MDTSEITIYHLLYMDNIKLYAKSEQGINSLIHLIQIYSDVIWTGEEWPDSNKEREVVKING